MESLGRKRAKILRDMQYFMMSILNSKMAARDT